MKHAYGPWMLTAFRWLANLKFLRGGPFVGRGGVALVEGDRLLGRDPRGVEQLVGRGRLGGQSGGLAGGHAGEKPAVPRLPGPFTGPEEK